MQVGWDKNLDLGDSFILHDMKGKPLNFPINTDKYDIEVQMGMFVSRCVLGPDREVMCNTYTAQVTIHELKKVKVGKKSTRVKKVPTGVEYVFQCVETGIQENPESLKVALVRFNKQLSLLMSRPLMSEEDIAQGMQNASSGDNV